MRGTERNNAGTLPEEERIIIADLLTNAIIFVHKVCVVYVISMILRCLLVFLGVVVAWMLLACQCQQQFPAHASRSAFAPVRHDDHSDTPLR